MDKEIWTKVDVLDGKYTYITYKSEMDRVHVLRYGESHFTIKDESAVKHMIALMDTLEMERNKHDSK